jgi:L-glyceraldehyde 3-phosphate reductase
VLRDERVTTVLIGASSVEQLDDNLAVLDNLEISETELDAIEQDAHDSGTHNRAQSSQE